jgi:hypothetical protein
MKRYGHVSFGNDRWPEGFLISFEAQEGGFGRVIFGVATDKRPPEETLMRNLKQYYGGASSSEHYPWHLSLLVSLTQVLS